MNNQQQQVLWVYVGTYTRKESEGIYGYRFDPATGTLMFAGVGRGIENPSFLALHPNRRYLYAVNEVGTDGGGVSAFALDNDGALTFINHRLSQGRSPCHLSVDDAGAFIYAANYGTGTALVYAIRAGGGLEPVSDIVQHEGSGPNEHRQRGPHAHSINLSPDNRFAFVPDLGIDRVMIYDIATEPGKLIPHGYAQVTGGSGPRHFTFHPNRDLAYLINEMGNTITAFTYDVEAGVLAEFQTVPTLPDDFEGENTTADIHVAPSGKFLYGSNRGHDSIVIYAIDAAGRLTYVGHTSTQGKTPRNFAIDPTGSFLLAANQDSDNIVVFRLNQETGDLIPTGHEVKVSMPVCVKFLEKA